MHKPRFLLVSTIYLAYFLIGAAISVGARWPAQFGGQGDPNSVAIEFVTRGTALAAPLPLVVVFGGLILLARRRDRWERIGIVGIMGLSILFLIGSIGEAFAPPTPDVPRSILMASGVIGMLMSISLLGTGTAVLRRK